MKPQDDYRNGIDMERGDSASSTLSDDSDGEEGAEDEFVVEDSGAPARALAALNALRKSRQHYDVTLVADGGEGGEVWAHRAVLAAASPYLLQRLAAAPAPAYRVRAVPADELRALVEFAYTGRVRARDPPAARRLYRAAWRLRMDALRLLLLERLAGRVQRAPRAEALAVRALPDLPSDLLSTLDAYIGEHFEEMCASGALAGLPEVRIEMLRESSADDGEEASAAVAEAALTFLVTAAPPDTDVSVSVSEVMARTHLVYVDAAGALRDCGELPAARGDAQHLQEYRREAAERRRAPAPAASSAAGELELGAREVRGPSGVVAARRSTGAGAGATRALLSLRGRLVSAHVSWRSAGGGPVTRGAPLGGDAARDALDEGERLSEMGSARCAAGVAALGGRLVAAGGYDRARALRSAEGYSPAANRWEPLPDMGAPRARTAAAVLGAALYALGGSDGHAELASVERLAGSRWEPCGAMPAARSHAAAAADEARGALYVVGGWSGGACLRLVHRYSSRDARWSAAPPLGAPRSQAAAVVWHDALWALGGCDAWRCLASVERLPLAGGEAAWEECAALPAARRAAGGAVWRGALVVAGGSAGAASLRRTDWLPAPAPAADWRAGPALRRARAGLGLAALGPALYAVGGYSGQEFLSCVECLLELDGEWTTLLRRAPVPPPLTQQEEEEEEEEEKAEQPAH